MHKNNVFAYNCQSTLGDHSCISTAPRAQPKCQCTNGSATHPLLRTNVPLCKLCVYYLLESAPLWAFTSSEQCQHAIPAHGTGNVNHITSTGRQDSAPSADRRGPRRSGATASPQLTKPTDRGRVGHRPRRLGPGPGATRASAKGRTIKAGVTAKCLRPRANARR